MALHPEVEAVVSTVSPFPASVLNDVVARRQAYRELAVTMWPTPPAVALVESHVLELDGRSLAARLYIPARDEGRALLLFFHGGSFIVGDLDSHDAICRRLAEDTSMRVLSVDYRLAPENPFPAAVNDAIDVTRFVIAHVGEFSQPQSRVVVVGDSAGATLAAVAAAATRGDAKPPFAQVLLYPTLGPEVLTGSAHNFAAGFLLEVEQLRRDYVTYLAGASPIDERIAPLMSLDLSGSIPAIIVVAECDPLRDEAIAYAGLLEHFGGRVEVLEAEGMTHGFLRLGGVVPDALSILDDLAQHLHDLVASS